MVFCPIAKGNMHKVQRLITHESLDRILTCSIKLERGECLYLKDGSTRSEAHQIYKSQQNPSEGDRIHTPPEKRSLRPVHGEHTPRPEANAFRKIDATPEIHGRQTAAETQTTKVEYRRVADIRQAAEVPVPKRFVHRRVDVPVFDIVGTHARQRRSDL